MDKGREIARDKKIIAEPERGTHTQTDESLSVAEV